MKSFITSLIFLVCMFQTAFAESTFLKEVRGWGIILDKDSGSESCRAATEYRNGVTVIFGKFNEDGQWRLLLSNPDWKSIVADQKYEIDYIFDNRTRWSGEDTGVPNGLLAVGLKEEFINNLGAANSLQVQYKGNEITRLSLRGTKAAQIAIEECHTNFIVNKDPFAPNDPFASSSSDNLVEEEKSDADIVITTDEFITGRAIRKTVCLSQISCVETTALTEIEIVGSEEGGTIKLFANRNGRKENVLAFEIGYPAFSGLNFHLADVDTGNNTDEIVVSYYTGGAHCCTHHMVVSKVGDSFRAVDLGHHDGDAELSADSLKSGVFEYIDGRFLYAFAPYALSSAPLQFIEVKNGKAIDVSRDGRFRKIQQNHAKELLDRCNNFEQPSACASYVATAALLGEFDKAWEYVLTNYELERDKDKWFPSFCRQEYNDDGCPEGQSIEFSSLPEALKYSLATWGYINEDDAVWVNEEEIETFKAFTADGNSSFKRFWDGYEQIGQDALNILKLKERGIITDFYDCPIIFRDGCFQLFNDPNPKSEDYTYHEWGDWVDYIGNDKFKMQKFVSEHMHRARLAGFELFQESELVSKASLAVENGIWKFRQGEEDWGVTCEINIDHQDASVRVINGDLFLIAPIPDSFGNEKRRITASLDEDTIFTLDATAGEYFSDEIEVYFVEGFLAKLSNTKRLKLQIDTLLNLELTMDGFQSSLKKMNTCKVDNNIKQ